MTKARAKPSKLTSGYNTEVEAAAKLNLSTRTLRKWRQTGEGPPYTKVAKQYLYRDESLLSWLRSREVRPIRQKHAA